MLKKIRILFGTKQMYRYADEEPNNLQSSLTLIDPG